MKTYFLGGTTSEGFKSDFGKILFSPDNYAYILKGGPGTGKSSLMKKIAETFDKTDDIDIYFCSSDINSLDAVVLNKKGIVIVDGTAPHTFDPEYAGARQCIINLGECWNNEKLKKYSDEIVKVTDENISWHKRCRRYIKALSSVNSDIYSIGESSLDKEKLCKFIERFVKKNIPDKKIGCGESVFKKLSVMTQNGYVTSETGCKNIYILSDGIFAGSDFMLRKIEDYAIARGYKIIVSNCDLFNGTIYEHIIIPELDMALISSTPLNKNEIKGNKINFSRFYIPTMVSQKKERIAFSKKASTNLAEEAAYSIKSAKEVHDKIEEYYISAVDFNKINKVTEKLIKEIEKK
ncbi:MAG: ATPase [Oscillospiraceae bacterium]